MVSSACGSSGVASYKKQHRVVASLEFLLRELKVCIQRRDIERGRVIHAAAVEYGEDSDVKVASTLVRMYSKCGNLEEAQSVFDQMKSPNVVSWTALISGYAENGEGQIALELFSRLEEPDALAFVAALKSCLSLTGSREEVLSSVMAVHYRAVSCSCECDIFVANTLVDVYGKCKSTMFARRLFDSMLHRDVVSWTALMAGYADNGEDQLALDCYQDMHKQGFVPTCVTFVALLKACSNLAGDNRSRSLEETWKVEVQAATYGHTENIFVANRLIDAYVKCGSMSNALRVFETMPRPDIVSWNSLMFGYVENCKYDEVFNIYASMTMLPTALTFVAVLKACCDIGSVTAIHAQASIMGFDKKETMVANTLVDVYAKLGGLESAYRVFQQIPYPNVVSWNITLLGFAENGEGLQALKMLACMYCQGFQPNDVSYIALLKACVCIAGRTSKAAAMGYAMAIHSHATATNHDGYVYVENSLLDLYAKCGSMLYSRRVFDAKREVPSVASWNALLAGYVDNGQGKTALNMFLRMKLDPDVATIAAVLKGCATSMQLGLAVHAWVRLLGFEIEEALATTLVDFYGKCGAMAQAQQLFDSLEARTLTTWNALMAGYAQNGDMNQVLDLFARMGDSGFEPNGITFLSLLSACRQGGLVGEAKRYFKTMLEYGIQPALQHYGCMIHILGSANELDAAVAMVQNMPFKADPAIWTSVFLASEKWKNTLIGKLALDSLKRLQEELSA